MHPAISAFPRNHIYAGRLRDGIDASSRPTPSGYLWPDPPKPTMALPSNPSPGVIVLNLHPDFSF